MKKFLVILGLIVLVITAYYFFPEKRLPAKIAIDKIVVRKSEHGLYVFSNGKEIKRYSVSLGRQPTGDKRTEGDKRTPEGMYQIDSKNPNSGFHKNLGISYPNAIDRNEAKAAGVKPGGEIKIHGIRNGFGFIGKFQRWYDWTAGCIALTNEEVDELYNTVEIGTPIEILP